MATIMLSQSSYRQPTLLNSDPISLRYADARSHLTPPVQYISTFLPARSSRWDLRAGAGAQVANTHVHTYMCAMGAGEAGSGEADTCGSLLLPYTTQ